MGCSQRRNLSIQIEQDKALAIATDRVEANHRLKAGESRWKMGIKECKLEKHVPVSHIRKLVVTRGKRVRATAKAPIYLIGETHVAPARTEPFKKRKVTRESEAVSPSAENITYQAPSPTAATIRPEIIEESSFSQITLENRVSSLMPDISWALLDDSLSNSETHSIRTSGPGVTVPKPSSYGSFPRCSFISPSDSSSETAGHHPASDILAFELNGMNICSNWSSKPRSEVLETTENASQTDSYPDMALFLGGNYEVLLSRTLEIQQKVRTIAEELEDTEISFEHCTVLLTERDNLVKFVAFRALINSYQSQIIYQQEATQYFLATIHFVTDSHFSSQHQMSLFYTDRLEQLSKMINKIHETDLRYREATMGVEMSFGFEDGLQCRNFLASILSGIHRDEEALNLLLGGFTDYLSTPLSPNGSGPLSRITFKEGLPQKLRSEAFMQMTKLIQMLHWKVDHDGSLTGAIEKMSGIQELVRTNLNFQHLADEAVVIQTMSLAFEYSQALMFHRADLVYQFALPELLRLRDNWYSFRKASEIKDYAQHCQRSNRWISSMEALKVTFKYMELSKGYPRDHLDQALVTTLDQLGINFRQHWLSTQTSTGKDGSDSIAFRNARLSRQEFASKMNETVLGSEWWMEDPESQLEGTQMSL